MGFTAWDDSLTDRDQGISLGYLKSLSLPPQGDSGIAMCIWGGHPLWSAKDAFLKTGKKEDKQVLFKPLDSLRTTRGVNGTHNFHHSRV